jgi:hypothetical protein
MRMSIVVVVLMLLPLVACETLRPVPYGIGKTPEGGSPEFTQGWEDGCESGIQAYGTDMYKMSYTFKQDYELTKNPEYYSAWKDAWSYCRWYTFNWAKSWEGKGSAELQGSPFPMGW